MRKFFVNICNYFRKLFGFKISKSLVKSISSASISIPFFKNFSKVPRLIVPPDIYGMMVANHRYY